MKNTITIKIEQTKGDEVLTSKVIFTSFIKAHKYITALYKEHKLMKDTQSWQDGQYNPIYLKVNTTLR